MGEYERSITIEAPVDKVENFVSDVRNLPKYLPTTRKAEPVPDERVRVQGEARGKEYDSDGFYHVDKSKHRMEWRSDGEIQYSGWLEFKDAGVNKSNVTVHLSYDPSFNQKKDFKAQTGNIDATINQELEKALLSIKNIVEGKGGKIEK